jgi:hypothetical protein
MNQYILIFVLHEASLTQKHSDMEDRPKQVSGAQNNGRLGNAQAGCLVTGTQMVTCVDRRFQFQPQRRIQIESYVNLMLCQSHFGGDAVFTHHSK